MRRKISPRRVISPRVSIPGAGSCPGRIDISLFDAHLLSFGVDFREDKVDSSTGYALTSRDNTGVFGQYGVNFHGHQLIASVRRDDDEVFGGKTTGGVGWSYAWQRCPALVCLVRYGLQDAQLQRTVFSILRQPRPESRRRPGLTRRDWRGVTSVIWSGVSGRIGSMRKT